MEKRNLNRKKICTTLDKELIPKLEELHQKTRIPKTRLMDEAVEELLKKYNQN